MEENIVCDDCGVKKNNYKVRYYSSRFGDLVNFGEHVCDDCLDQRIARKKKELSEKKYK